MDDDQMTRHPTADAIRDSVRAEDPSRWGTRDLSKTTTRGTARDMDHRERGAGRTMDRSMDRSMDRDADRQSGRDRSTRLSEGYIPPTQPLASGPVATDPTPATYTGSPVTPIGTGAGVTHTTDTTDRTVSYRDRVEDRGRIARSEPPVEHRRFSLGATFLGWAVAAFFTLVFSAIGLALVGGTAFNEDGQLSFSDANGLALGSLVAYLIAAFLAYLIGGYAAGRIALWDGVKHGLGTVAWAVLFALVALIAGTALADTFNLQSYLGGFDLGAITGETILAIVLSLAAMLGGAALGGKMGERYHDRVHGIDRRTHRAGRIRGRPL